MTSKISVSSSGITLELDNLDNTILDQLDLSDEKIVDPSQLYKLSSESKNELGIKHPQQNSVTAKIDTLNGVGDRNFSLSVTFKYKGRVISKSSFVAPCFEDFGEVYLIPLNLFNLINIIHEFNTLPKTDYKDRADVITKIKELANNSKLIELNDFLKNTEAKVLTAIPDITENDDGTVSFDIKIEGIPDDERSNKENLINNPDFIFSKKENGKVILHKIPERSHQHLKRQKAIRDVARKQFENRIPRTEAPKLIRSLKEVIETLDPDQLSERFAGWGVFSKRALPKFEGRTEPDGLRVTDIVFPAIPVEYYKLEENGSSYKTEFRPNSIEEIDEAIKKVKDAQLAGNDHIVINDLVVPINPHKEIIDQLERQKEHMTARKEARARNNDLKRDEQERALSQENISQINFGANLNSAKEIPNHLNNVQPRFLKKHIKTTRGTKELKLFDYQFEGINWFIETGSIDPPGHCGGLLADVMGLGKTLQTISYFCHLAETEGLTSVLIICPKSLIRNWASEIEKFVDQTQLKMNIIQIDNFRKVSEATWHNILVNQSTTSIMITSYPQIQRHYERLLPYDFDVMVCDEAQEFKNPGLLLHNAMACLKAKRKYALTGTPVENRLADLWSIMDIVKPSLLGSMEDFTKSFETPLSKLPDEGPERDKLADILKNEMGIYFYRRTKKVLKAKGVLKECIDFEEQIEANKSLLGIYGRARERIDINPKEVIGVIQDLRLRSSNVTRFPEESFNSPKELVDANVKLPWLLKTVREIKGRNEKALIFEHFNNNIKMLKMVLEAEFPELKPIEFINKDVTAKNRDRIVRDFEDRSEFDVILLTPRTAGVGLNLVSANNVIHFTREWNPAKEAQATDRAYRCGQVKDVNVYYPITVFPNEQSYEGHKTIEQRVHQILTDKKKLIEDFTHSAARFNADLLALVNGKEVNYEKPNDLEVDPNDIVSIDDTFFKLKPHEFEAFCAILLERSGRYEDCKIILTPKSGDGGVDIVAKNGKDIHLFECKHKSRAGNRLQGKAIQQLAFAKDSFIINGFEVLSRTVLTNAETASSKVEDEMDTHLIDVFFSDELKELAEEAGSITYKEVEIRNLLREKI